MDKIKVLFVDDDMVLGNIVTLVLEDSGYEVHYQTSLAGIKMVVKEMQPDIMVLDVEIGAKNGIEVVPELKAIVPETPVLIVSSHVESENVMKALEAGAVTYLKKPFEIVELLAYIQRFVKTFRVKGLEVGRLHLKAEESLLMKGDETVRKLSTLECKLLKMLALNLNRTVTREQIELELWGDYVTESSEQSLNNYIAKLRKYLVEDKRLELATIPKVGYKLSDGE